MMPANASYDVTHLGLADAKHAPKLALHDATRGIQRPHALGVVGRNLAVAVTFAGLDAVIGPRATRHNLPDLPSRYPKLSGHGDLAGRSIGPAFAYLLNLVTRQFRMDILFATRRITRKACRCARTVAALFGSVGVVFSDGSEKQVGRVAATRIVTAVAYAQAIWNRSVGLHPREPMRVDVVPHAVSELVGRACPWPTFVWLALRHVGMKPGDVCWRERCEFHASMIAQVGV